LAAPKGLVFDSSGYLYVASGDIGTVGTIEKFNSSGNGTSFASGLAGPRGLAFENNGYLYVSCFTTIEKFDSSGNGTTFASDVFAQGLAFDSSGCLFAATGNNIIKFDSSGDWSIFASGLYGAEGIAAQVPEPATLLLFALGGFFASRRNFR
jgi:hypothetical protein